MSTTKGMNKGQMVPANPNSSKPTKSKTNNLNPKVSVKKSPKKAAMPKAATPKKAAVRKNATLAVDPLFAKRSAAAKAAWQTRLRNQRAAARAAKKK